MDRRTTMAGRKRNRLRGAPPPWSAVRDRLHMRVKDAAAELKVPIGCLRRLCKQNGFPNWPGKRIRQTKSIWQNLLLPQVGAPEGSARAGLAGPSQLTKIAETKKEEEVDMTSIQQAAPVANPPPGHGEELTTLNLIDKLDEVTTLNLIDKLDRPLY